MRIQHGITFAVAALLGVAPVADAQKPAALGTTRVTLVEGPSLAQGSRAEALRRAQRLPQNLVIVDRNATAEDLAAALAMIGALRHRYGDSLTFDVRARPESIRPGPAWAKSAYRAWLAQQLMRLRGAIPDSLAELGFVRSVQITLPAPRGRFTAETAGPR